MNVRSAVESFLPKIRQRPVLAGAAALAVLILLALLINVSGPDEGESNFFEVRRGDFLISVVEGGTVEAVNEVVIRSDVEGTARIIFIVPEGSYVKKSNLLVELDSSTSQDAVNQQQINVEKAQFALIQAEQQLEIQKSTVDSEIAAAKLKVEFAQSDLDKYVKGEMLQTRRNAEIEITNVLETLKINEERLEWTEKLYEKGYETKSNLDKDRLAVSQTKLKLEQSQKALWMLQTFDEPKKKRELEATLHEAQEDLERVRLQGERKLAQYEADVTTQKSTLDLSKKKLERDLKQLEATKIYAPQDGLVVYAGGSSSRFSSESMIEEGAVVRNRQELIKLPDVSAMKLQVKIHESYINQVRVGQAAFVVLDAMPDQRFLGEVRKVAPIPDSGSRWANPNLKVYATEIRILDELPDVKPGVSARAEIVVTNLQDVLTVPIQAVTTWKGKQVVYLARAPQTPVPVNVGMYNTKFIEVTSGIEAGDRILMSPPFDVEGKDLGGAVIAQGDTLPAVSGTNRPAMRGQDEDKGIAAVFGENAGPGMPRSPGEGGPGSGRPNGEGPGTFRGPGGPDGGEMRGPRGPRSDGEGGRPRFNREEILKQFDKNGDGELDDTERAAMMERFSRDRRRSGSPTNSVPNQPPPNTDVSR